MQKMLEMIILWMVMIIFVFISIEESKIKFKTKRRILMVFILLFSLASSYRTLGLDIEVYRDKFDLLGIQNIAQYFNIKNIFQNTHEPLFYLEITILKRMRLGFSSYLFLNTFIPFFIVYKIVSKNKKNMIRTFTLFLLLNAFSIDISRQFLADSLFLVAITSNNLKGLVLSICSGLAHFSNFISVAAWPFLKKKVNKLFYNWILIIIIIISFLIKNILFNINTSDNQLLSRFVYYLEYNSLYYTYANQIQKITFYLMILYIPIFAIVFAQTLYNKLDNIFKDDIRIVNAQRIGILVFVIVNFVLNASTMAARFFSTLNIGFFILLSNYMDTCSSKKKIGIYLIIIGYNLICSIYYLGTFTNWMF